MRKIKILQFPIANARGGITQYALKNWEFIDKNKFQFDFATLSKELDFERELTQQGCKVHYISCYAEENEEQFIAEMDQILDEEYDVVHLHTSYWKSFLAEELSIRHGVPKIIVHAHSSMVDIMNEEKRNKAIEIHNLRRKQFSTSLATDFRACSQQAADWLFREQIPRDKIKIIKNAIDVQKFSYNERIRNEYRKKLGLENCFVVGHIGRFVYQKNHDFLVEVFKKICNVIPNLKLMLIGAGELEENVRQKVLGYELEEKVIFMGKRNDISCLLQAMDLFLLPSRFEGLPIVLVEAQASGIKCLASTAITNEAAITDNIEFIPLSVNKWVEKINCYSKGYNRTNVDDIISNAGYNIRHQVKEIEKLYCDE